MADEFGPDFITLTDEDGNDFELEYIMTLEHKGETYMTFFPTAESEEEEMNAEQFGVVILKVEVVNGEELLSTVDDETELDEVFELFNEQIAEEDGEDR